MRKIVVGITGASGAIYAKQLLEKLRAHAAVEVAVVCTDCGEQVFRHELGDEAFAAIPFRRYANHDFHAPFASGSCDFDTMIIAPCSMGSLARIANGYSNDLLARAADVMLKERRRLIVLAREMPLNLIHLRNMQQLAEAGAIICPACPSFYHHPDTLEAAAETVVQRVLQLAGLEQDGKKWGEVDLQV
ncbi:MAG: UbiX family flavin prenyltransferase [Prevotellaceae bacterium]|jgi:4-hydroxy-3-polyprenylbenzoate decarboxylase|nr:UbiX family flavin prenyltransferase [Prevotellaceae bacterium]